MQRVVDAREKQEKEQNHEIVEDWEDKWLLMPSSTAWARLKAFKYRFKEE